MGNDHHLLWLRAAVNAKTHREIFALATELYRAETASLSVRKAARKVVKCLGDVIDLPIANAVVLAKADRRFAALVEVVRLEANSQLVVAYGC